MTRKIIIAVIFTAFVVPNLSFSSGSLRKTTSTAQADQKTISVCLHTLNCTFCGAAAIHPVVTTVCASANCFGIRLTLCVNFARTINPVTGKEEVDESSITIDYSDPAMKAQTDEAALKADFIQQVNAQL